MEEKENLLSAATAAKILNVSRTTLSRLVASGQLATYRIGHKTLFDQKILDEFKASVLSPAQRNVEERGTADGNYSAGEQQVRG